jgi:hypothetical protein
MRLVFLLSFLAAAVQAAIVPAVAPKDHFHSAIPSTVAPQGKNVTINGVLTYVSLPKKKFDPTIAVLMLMGEYQIYAGSLPFKLHDYLNKCRCIWFTLAGQPRKCNSMT